MDKMSRIGLSVFAVTLLLGPVSALAGSSPTMQKANLDGMEVHAYGKISKQVAEMNGLTAVKVTFQPGAKWSHDLKPHAGTEMCDLPHVAYVLSGAMEVQMKDGSKEIFRKGDIMMLPPQHDAWTIGDEPFVFVQMSAGDDYYADQVKKLAK